MASTDKRRNLRAWRNKRDRLMRLAKRPGADPTICWICSNEIDVHLPYTDAWALTWDHFESLATGGHVLGDVLPSHRRCNSSRGDGTRSNPLAGTTREW